MNNSPIQWIIYVIVIIIAILSIFIHKTEASEKFWADPNDYRQFEWNSGTWSKYDNLIEIGFNPNFTIHLIDQCKFHAQDPVNCIKVGAFIAGAESSMGNRCYRHNCVGMNDGAVGYKDNMYGVNAWVMKYNKYWYRQITPKSFYRADGIPPVTHYCMGKKKDGVCKEGTKNSWKIFNSLNF